MSRTDEIRQMLEAQARIRTERAMRAATISDRALEAMDDEQVIAYIKSGAADVPARDAIRARRDAILAGTQADWDEGKVFEATGVTPEAKREADPRRHGDPSWHLRYLDTLQRDYPDIYRQVTGTAVSENAAELAAAGCGCWNFTHLGHCMHIFRTGA